MDTGMVMLGHCTIQLLCCSVPLLNMSLYGFHSGYESELKQTLLKCINLLHFLQHICLYYPSTLSLWGLVFHCQMYLERPNMDQSFLLRFKTPTSSPTENNVDNKDSDSSVYFPEFTYCLLRSCFFPQLLPVMESVGWSDTAGRCSWGSKLVLEVFPAVYQVWGLVLSKVCSSMSLCSTAELCF